MRKLKTIDAHTESVRTLGFVNDGALLLTGCLLYTSDAADE